MRKGSDQSKYCRAKGGTDIWGLTYKCGSTSLLQHLGREKRYVIPEPGDHVRIVVRDPRDRLVSAWKWFTTGHKSYIKHILDQSQEDHDKLLRKTTMLADWVPVAFKYWDPHWAPQTEIHTRWREFEIIPISELHRYVDGHEKRTREDNSWEQYYDPATLARVEDYYKEDMAMWQEVTNGADTRTRTVL